MKPKWVYPPQYKRDQRIGKQQLLNLETLHTMTKPDSSTNPPQARGWWHRVKRVIQRVSDYLLRDRRHWVERGAWVLFLLLAVMLVLTVFFYGSGKWEAFAQRMDFWLGIDTDSGSKGRILTLLGLTLGGILLLLNARAIMRRAEAQQATADAQAEDVQVAREANQQVIFKDGFTSLGSESESVRLGGIYCLYDLAANNPERTQNIVEVLCAHLRATTQQKQYQDDFQQQPSNEIASILRLLTGEQSIVLRRNAREIKAKYHLDFSGAFLNGAALEWALLCGAALPGASLQMARLQDAQLQAANIRAAQLQIAHLQNAQMQKSDLRGAQMQRAGLLSAQLQGARLSSAHLQGACLWGAQLQGADLGATHLQAASLRGAQLQGANLMQAQLQGADLRMACLQAACLWNAQLQGCLIGGLPPKQQGQADVLLKLHEANREETQMQGAYSRTPGQSSLLANIKSRTGKEAELSTAVFSGGLSERDKAEIEKACKYALDMRRTDRASYYQTDDWEAKLRLDGLLNALDKHVGKEPDHTPPKGANTGKLEQEMAQKIMAEYNKAMEN